MRPRHLALLSLLPPLLGCGGAGAPPSSASGSCTYPSLASPAPGTTPAFRAVILPMLQTSCGSPTASCHGSAQTLRIVFETTRTAQNVYDDLMLTSPQSGWPRIKPGDPAGSWVYEKVTSTSPGGGGGGFGTRMPQTLPPLCAGAVDNLRAWIQAGAPNN